MDDSKVVARRDLDKKQQERPARELSAYCEGNPEYEFNSIWTFQDFVLNCELPDERSARQRGEGELDETHRRFDA